MNETKQNKTGEKEEWAKDSHPHAGQRMNLPTGFPKIMKDRSQPQYCIKMISKKQQQKEVY
jgi:hypothetical protein